LIGEKPWTLKINPKCRFFGCLWDRLLLGCRLLMVELSAGLWRKSLFIARRVARLAPKVWPACYRVYSMSKTLLRIIRVRINNDYPVNGFGVPANSLGVRDVSKAARWTRYLDGWAMSIRGLTPLLAIALAVLTLSGCVARTYRACYGASLKDRPMVYALFVTLHLLSGHTQTYFRWAYTNGVACRSAGDDELRSLSRDHISLSASFKCKMTTPQSMGYAG
jgi:hypothetical protein